MTTSSTWRRAASVSSRVIDGRAVLVIHDRGTLHSLNAAGTALWEALPEHGAAFTTLRDVLARRYELSEEIAGQDALRFLRTLQEVGAVVEGDQP